MRETLYIKDDDYRLSFVSGNFVTLTNLSDSDVKRIIDMKLSPLYVSVHSLDEDIRRKLLGVKNCRPLFPLLKLFCDNGIIVHTQIVLCPGINDADLLNTLAGLAALYPGVESAAVVPVGLTAHRSGLPVLKPVGLEAATAAVAAVEKINSELNAGFAFCADEIYLEADLPFPDYESYGDFVQIENGVGLMTKFAVEFDEALIYAKKVRKKSFTVITGKSAEDFMLGIIGLAKEMFPDLDVEILAVANSFFGESVTVAGLVTGGDILKELPEGCSDLIIPAVMLRELENVFLDGMTLEELSAAAKRKVTVCPVDGYEFAKKLLII